MGATAKPSPDFFTDGIAFTERTGKLNRWYELLCLGLEPDTMSGGFSSEKADILLNFVRRDPAYHIITFASDRYVNRFEPGRNNIYYLADGDADPNLASWGFLGLLGVGHLRQLIDTSSTPQNMTTKDLGLSLA